MVKTLVDVAKNRVVKLGSNPSPQALKDKVQPFSKYKKTTSTSNLTFPSDSLVRINIANNNLEIRWLDPQPRPLTRISLNSTISLNVSGNNFNINWSNTAPIPVPTPNNTPTPVPNTQPIPTNTTPSSANYYSNASLALGEMYMNDTLGDCVIAEMGHQIGVFTSYNGGTPYIFTNTQIVTLYSAIAGYVPGEPSTDNGTDPLTAWNYWKNTGAPIGLNKIAGYVSVNAANNSEVMEAIDLFENVAFAVNLPDAWINPFPSANGFIWDVAGASDPDNGHCFAGVGYNANGVIINTWGMIGTLTWAAVEKYAVAKSDGALYTMITTELLNAQSQTSITGLNWAQLESDLQTL